MGRSRLYARLLRLYPTAFRHRFADAMEQDFARLRSELGWLRAWSIALADLVRSAPRERAAARTGSHRAGRLAGWRTDAANALRVLVRRPGPALAVVATLALGVGATTALFSVVDAVVLSPMPYPHPDRLVRVWERTPQGGRFSTAEANFLDFRERATSFRDLAAFASAQRTLLSDGVAERLTTLRATPGLTEVLGVTPLLGRAFREGEGTMAGRRDVVLLSRGLWERRFGADPDVIGRTLTLDGRAHEVVGVLPAGVIVPEDPDIWVPLVAMPRADRGDHEIEMIGRLRDGTTLDAARRDLAAIAADLSREHPSTNAGWGIDMLPVPEWIIGPDLRRTMAVLFIAGGLLLLVACTNASNLLLVRATERSREIGVRAALGAGRARIARQLVLESAFLSLFAGGLGALLAAVGVPLIVRLAPAGIPRLAEAAVDGRVLSFSLATSLAVGIGFGMVPALHAIRRNVFAALRSGSRVDGSGGRRARRIMLVAQLALATVVVIGATLLRSSFERLQRVNVGFDADRVIAVPLALTGPSFEGENAGSEFLVRAQERIGALPGVEAVGATNISPLSGGGTVVDITVEGDAPRMQSDARFTDWRAVTEGALPALGVPLLAGRMFTPGESRRGDDVVVVSQTFVDRYMQGRSPVGLSVAFGTNGTNWRRVVGVVGDVRDRAVAEAVRPMLYVPNGFYPLPYMTLLIRTERDAAAMAPSIRRELRALDPGLPVTEVRGLSSYRAESVAGARFAMTLMTAFAALALALAILGVYGTTLYDVTRRSREFGLRAALGARRPALLRLVVRETLSPLALGLTFGILAAVGAAGLLASVLYETAPRGPVAYGVAALVLTSAALVAVAIPAIRATRVDPAATLNAD